MRLLRVAVHLVVLIAVVALPGAANVINVDCASGGSIQAAVDSLVGVPGPHTIYISGTCTENVLVDRIDGLSLIGNPSATVVSAAEEFGAVIAFSRSREGLVQKINVDAAGQFVTGIIAERSEIGILQCTVVNSTDVGVIAFDQSRVDIGPGAGATVISGNAAGVWAFQDSSLVLNRTTIENNSGDGLVIQNRSVAQIRGGLQGNIIRNNGFGVGITNGSEATFAGNNLIQNNGAYGMLVTRNSQVNVNGSVLSSSDKRFTTIEGNTQFGILLGDSNLAFNGPVGEPLHVIRNNAIGATGIHAGVFQFRPSTLLLRQTRLENNGGHGVHVFAGGYVAFSDAAVTGSELDGVRLEHNSLAEFGGFFATGESAPANTAITGNGGQPISCDGTSEVFGDLSAFKNVVCTQQKNRGAAPANAQAGFEQQFEQRMRRKRKATQ